MCDRYGRSKSGVLDKMRLDDISKTAMAYPYSRAGLLVVAIASLIIIPVLNLLWLRNRRRKLAAQTNLHTQLPELKIEPLVDFNWENTMPRKLRPFKPTYHITMAIQADTPSDWITIDKDYLDRVTLRRNLLLQQGNTVHKCLPTGTDAVRELYTYLLGHYLPTRYPTMFRLSSDKRMFINLVTGSEFPTTPGSNDMDAALRVIGETVEEDMFLLRETPEGHFTDAFVCCFPASFDGSSKLGKLLKDVHTPVPSYKKIETSMERFFKRLEVGKSVKRMNWSIQTDRTLFHPKAHATADNDRSDEKEDFDIEDTCARIELQTLTRLPHSRSILFSFKTYLYPITDLKSEGLGPDLIAAIEGLDAGNAPGMRVYKGSAKWGERVLAYLRS